MEAQLPELSDQDIRGQLQAMPAGWPGSACSPSSRTDPHGAGGPLLPPPARGVRARGFQAGLPDRPGHPSVPHRGPEAVPRGDHCPQKKPGFTPRTRILNHRWDRPGTFPASRAHRREDDGRVRAAGSAREDPGDLDQPADPGLRPPPGAGPGISPRDRRLLRQGASTCSRDLRAGLHRRLALAGRPPAPTSATIGVRDTPARALIERACACARPGDLPEPGGGGEPGWRGCSSEGRSASPGKRAVGAVLPA